MILNPTEKALEAALTFAEAKHANPSIARIIDLFKEQIATSSNFRYFEDVNNPGHYIIKCNGQAFVVFRDPEYDNEWFWDHYFQH